MMPGEVDVIIAIHDPERRIDRSVGSALASVCVSRVIVVCHNISSEPINSALGALLEDPRIEIHELHDGIRSPAGPFNLGLELATARFVSIMGSDDELVPGAIDDWLSLAECDAADMVIPPIRFAGGARVPTPPTRPFRRKRLDGVADRLVYRTAPLGLISRARFGALRFTPELATGEDLAYSTRIWFDGAQISRAVRGSEYLVHDDAVRVTGQRRTIRDDLAALLALVTDPFVTNLPQEARESLAVKLWRISVFGAAHYRSGAWTTADRFELARIVAELVSFAPGALEVLSRADRKLIEALVNTSISDNSIEVLERSRRRFLAPAALFPRRFSAAMRRDAPVRYFLATFLARHK